MYELVIFDCDGVLIDSELLASQIEVDELNRLGYSISIEKYLDVALGQTAAAVETYLLKEGFNLPENFWSYVEKIQESTFETQLVPIRGVKELIQSLSIPCCVASNSLGKRLHHTLSITGLFPFFHGRVFGRELVSRGKPAPDIYLYAAAQAGISPNKCLVIEDSVHGIRAGQSAGMEVWAFCGGSHFSHSRKNEVKQSGATQIFENMDMLTKSLLELLNPHKK